MVRSHSVLRILAVALALLSTSSLALADAATDLGLQVHSTVAAPGYPALELQPTRPVKDLRVTLDAPSGQKVVVGTRGVAAGQKRALPVRMGLGTQVFVASFQVTWGGKKPEREEFELHVTLTRAAKLKLTLRKQDVDLDARKITFRINNPPLKAVLSLHGENGLLDEVQADYTEKQAGGPLSIRWEDPGETIVYMDLKVHDRAGFWKGMRLTPFRIDIPHDDVVFESGKWDIKQREEPKLMATLGHIRKALAKHGTLLNLKLYVAGYTDTVGSKGANYTLSRNRARAIASWFKAHGVKVPILYQGFGEDVLAVKTKDDTPEPKNRRALYILSSQRPGKADGTPRANWQQLRARP